MSKRDWTLLRVAVVACVSDVYYGRLFFGDPDTQQVLWDTDVRPSDATFLALKVGGWVLQLKLKANLCLGLGVCCGYIVARHCYSRKAVLFVVLQRAAILSFGRQVGIQPVRLPEVGFPAVFP